MAQVPVELDAPATLIQDRLDMYPPKDRENTLPSEIFALEITSDCQRRVRASNARPSLCGKISVGKSRA